MRMIALSPSAWLWELHSHTELSICRYCYKILCYCPATALTQALWRNCGPESWRHLFRVTKQTSFCLQIYPEDNERFKGTEGVMLPRDSDLPVHVSFLFLFLFFKIFFSYRPFFKSHWICYNIVSVLCFSFQAVRHLQSPARDRTHISCIGRWSLNHWTTREVPTHVPSKDSLSIALCSPYSLYIPSPNSMKLQLHTQGPSPKSLPQVPLLFLEIYPPLSCTVGFFFFTTSPSSCGL